MNLIGVGKRFGTPEGCDDFLESIDSRNHQSVNHSAKEWVRGDVPRACSC
jgi:hypothetical protein